MSNDNLILFPKKRTPNIEMSESEAKWMVAGSLLVVLTLAIGINSSIFSQNFGSKANVADNQSQSQNSRMLASVQQRMGVNWEKKAFKVLSETDRRGLASVGEKPSIFDKFAITTLEGNYNIRKVDGKIAEIQFAENPNSQPKSLLGREQFLQDHLNLFAENVQTIEPIFSESNSDLLIERFRLVSAEGQDLGLVQMLLDKDQKLLSMTVQ